MGRCSIVSVVLPVLVIIYVHDVVTEASPLKIVNGTTAADGEFPYMVQLFSSVYGFLCGGSIIGPEWILTAGHCVEGGHADIIVYGTNKLGDVSSHNSIEVIDYYQHPKYITTTEGIPVYDVGILKLKEKILFSDKAQPIKLVEANATIPFHTQGVLSGWGYNVTSSRIPMEYLQKINLQLLTDQECTKKIDDHSGKESFNSTHNLCSDDFWNGECNGDSGSPYAINGTQYGIVSWSFKPCGIVPGTYSRISNSEYRNWIRRVTYI